MAYCKELIAAKLRRWEKYLLRFRLPSWEAIPNMGLYMEQVVELLKDYLDYMPPELKDEQVITGAAINNYVRRGILPPPNRKRYYRVHIAYLIMICTLKQSLSMTMVQKLLPPSAEEGTVRAAYESYAAQHNRTATYFVRQVRQASDQILDHAEPSETSVAQTEELIAASAIVSGFARLLAEKLTLLDDKTLENGGNIAIE